MMYEYIYQERHRGMTKESDWKDIRSHTNFAEAEREWNAQPAKGCGVDMRLIKRVVREDVIHFFRHDGSVFY